MELLLRLISIHTRIRNYILFTRTKNFRWTLQVLALDFFQPSSVYSGWLIQWQALKQTFHKVLLENMKELRNRWILLKVSSLYSLELGVIVVEHWNFIGIICYSHLERVARCEALRWVCKVLLVTVTVPDNRQRWDFIKTRTYLSYKPKNYKR